jgi:hypothetical protein
MQGKKFKYDEAPYKEISGIVPLSDDVGSTDQIKRLGSALNLTELKIPTSPKREDTVGREPPAAVGNKKGSADLRHRGDDDASATSPLGSKPRMLRSENPWL